MAAYMCFGKRSKSESEAYQPDKWYSRKWITCVCSSESGGGEYLCKKKKKGKAVNHYLEHKLENLGL